MSKVIFNGGHTVKRGAASRPLVVKNDIDISITNICLNFLFIRKKNHCDQNMNSVK